MIAGPYSSRSSTAESAISVDLTCRPFLQPHTRVVEYYTSCILQDRNEWSEVQPRLL